MTEVYQIGAPETDGERTARAGTVSPTKFTTQGSRIVPPEVRMAMKIKGTASTKHCWLTVSEREGGIAVESSIAETPILTCAEARELVKTVHRLVARIERRKAAPATTPNP